MDWLSTFFLRFILLLLFLLLLLLLFVRLFIIIVVKMRKNATKEKKERERNRGGNIWTDKSNKQQKIRERRYEYENYRQERWSRCCINKSRSIGFGTGLDRGAAIESSIWKKNWNANVSLLSTLNRLVVDVVVVVLVFDCAVFVYTYTYFFFAFLFCWWTHKQYRAPISSNIQRSGSSSLCE